MRKNNKNTNTRKTILASTGTLGVLSSVAILSVSTLNNAQNNNIINEKTSQSLQRAFVETAINPNRLIYMSETLSSTQTPVVDSSGNVNEDNVTKWKNFFANVKTLPESSAKNELLSLETQINGCVQLNRDIQLLREQAKENNLIQQFLSQLIATLVTESGFKQNMSDIEGVDNINDKMLELSGITEANVISEISAPSSFTQTDLIKDSLSATQNINLTSIAGADYKQLIKIAEINAATAGNYALKFSYRKNSSSLTASGILFIKNDENQISSSTPSQMLINLDIFGRKTEQTNNASLESALENFIFKKTTDGNLEVLVRVKTGQIFQNLQFITELSGTNNLASPSKFGILNVQATDTTSFLSTINNDQNSAKLVELTSPDVATRVQMFASSLTSKATKTISDGWEQDRKLEFYQVGSFSTELPLYFARGAESEAKNKLFSYAPINIYTNGLNSNVQQTITLTTDGVSATILTPATYDLFKDLKDQLLDEMKSAENFDKASTITLNSSLDSTSKITKQSLLFSDFFYGIGYRTETESWASVNRTSDTTHIAITDLSQKIFLEKPENFSETSLTTAQSTTKAKETINERTTVIGFLGTVYNEFSKANSGEFSGMKFNLGDQIVWTADGSSKARAGYSNIHTTSKKISGSANDLYQALNENWSKLANIMSVLFNTESNEARYTVSISNPANQITSNFLTKATEYTTNTTEVENIISQAISAVKNDTNVNGSITTDVDYNKLSSETKAKLANYMAELIKYQFGTIAKEFESRQYDPLYNEIKKVLSSPSNLTLSVLKDVSEILEVSQTNDGIDLIKYKNGAWSVLSSEETTTLQVALKSLFNLIYFNNGNIALGNSIFNSTNLSDPFSSLNAEALTTFENDSLDAKKNKVLIYNKILTTLGSSNYDLQKALNNMLTSGKPLSLGFNLESAIQNVINNVGTNAKKRTEKTYDSITVDSYYLDDIIAGTNTLIILNWKLNQIFNSGARFFAATNSSRYSAQELIDKINYIIATNPQVSSNELAIWSNILDNDYNYSKYSQDLSGRNGIEALNNKALSLTLDENIMADRDKATIAAAFVVEKILKVLWWVILALIGVGVLVASTTGVVSRERQVRLSSRPVLKLLLISGIVLGLVLAITAITLGIGII